MIETVLVLTKGSIFMITDIEIENETSVWKYHL